MIATYHNHSTWSDGKASVADLVNAAHTMQIAELGVSDHWVLHPRGTQFKWAMPTDRLADYVSEITSVKKRTSRVGEPMDRLGLEVDWHPGNAAPLKHVLEQYPFDYIIGSVHQIQLADGTEFMIDGSATAWEKLSQEQINQMHRQYWRNVRSLAESGVFDILAHIDLPKKFAFYPTIDLKGEIGDALDAIANANTSTGDALVVEVNTAGWHKPCADAYPALDILRECRRREIPSTINADAHHPEHLLRDFDRAAQRLADAGYQHIARFAERRVRMEPLGSH